MIEFGLGMRVSVEHALVELEGISNVAFSVRRLDFGREIDMNPVDPMGPLL